MLLKLSSSGRARQEGLWLLSWAHMVGLRQLDLRLIEERCSNDWSIGIQGIVIGMTSTTAETPRAHITNMAALGWFAWCAERLVDIIVDLLCRMSKGYWSGRRMPTVGQPERKHDAYPLGS